MNKTILFAFAFIALFALASGVLAQANDSNNSNGSPYGINLGNCKTDSVKAKNDCYKSIKDTSKNCTLMAKNKYQSQNFTKIEYKAEKKVCGGTYKQAKKECKNEYTSARNTCKQAIKAEKERVRASRGK